MAGNNRYQYSSFVRFLPLRCLGNINMVWIADALSKGIDGILLIGCKYGDDYQCHFVKGSELAFTRSENVRDKLKKMAVENERVELHQFEISEYEKLPRIFDEFMKVIERYG